MPLLHEYNDWDAKFDNFKLDSLYVAQALAGGDIQHQAWAERMARCADPLFFRTLTDKQSGEVVLKLVRGHFCKVRICPVCQWRRSLRIRARFFSIMPSLPAEGFWVYLVLTVSNCNLVDLRFTLEKMSAAWNRFIGYSALKKNLLGWVRTVEVTTGRNFMGFEAHPHFNVLICFKPEYVLGGYALSQGDFVRLWRKALKVVYDPVVFVRRVYPDQEGQDSLTEAAYEVLKYSTKIDNKLLVNTPWLREYALQVSGRNFFGSGGICKELLGETERETDEDLIGAGEGGIDKDRDELLFTFDPSPSIRRYNQVLLKC